jgi:hypothetical protein
MIGFLLRKTFFDLWDNMFKIAAHNAILLISSAALFGFSFIPTALALRLAGVLLGVLWSALYLNAGAAAAAKISNYESFTFLSIFGKFRAAFLPALLSTVLFCVMAAIFFSLIPFYLLLENAAGMFLAALSFWAGFLLPVFFLFLPAGNTRLTKKPHILLKSCLLLFLDNPLFCIAVFFLAVVLFTLSVFTAFLFPGPIGIALFLDEALRLRLLKYEWLEKTAGEGRGKRKIPWEAILADERQRLGDRSITSVIFPWKNDKH